MISKQWPTKIFGTMLICALILTGCGGGGSGDGAAPNPVPARNVVTVGAPSPARITATTFADEPLGPIELKGEITGDVASMEGKPVYLAIEDPQQIVGKVATLSLTRTVTGFAYLLSFNMNAPYATAGRFTGNVKVFACMDPACQQPIAGTPMSIPYELEVEPRLTVSRSEITVSVPFGTVPSPQQVDVSWSPLSKGWKASNNPNGQMLQTAYPTPIPASDHGWLTDRVLQVNFLAAQPGNYVNEIQVDNMATLPDGRSFMFSKIIKVNHTVTPSEVEFMVLPSTSLELTHSASSRESRFHHHQVLPNIGVHWMLLGVDYLTAAGQSGPVTSWWEDRTYKTCVGDPHSTGPWDCLVPGIYTAQLRYRIVTAQSTRDITVPVRMTVTP